MMRTLIWKEFWQNSRVLLAVAIVAIAPYLVLPSIAISEMIADAIKSDDRHVAPQWSDIIQSAALCSMVLSTVLAAFVGGNVFAGERADRSAEFAAGLPIPRRGVLAAKAIVSMGFCLGLWLVNAAAIVLIDPSILSDDHDHVRDPDQLLLLTIPLVGVITSYAFGWLYSSRLKSPAIAAAGSLGTITAMILFTQSMRGYRPELIDHSLPVLLFVAAPLLALGAFTTGIGWYLRRTEP